MYPPNPRVDIPGEGSFVEYKTDDQFAPLAQNLAGAAAERVIHFRQLFPSIEATSSVLGEATRSADVTKAGVDALVDAGIALGLVGHHGAAQERFDKYLRWDQSAEAQTWRADWQDARADRVRKLQGELRDQERFGAIIASDVRCVRQEIKLDPDVPLPL
jgi:hypothetical protein